MSVVRHKRVRLLTVCVLLVAIILCGRMILSKMDDEVNVMKGKFIDAQSEQYAAIKSLNALQNELKIAATDEYIASLARTEHGFLRPGEVRYEVLNLESMMEEPAQ